MTPVFCTKKYYRYTIVDLQKFANEVENGIYGNPTVFANPPMTKNAFMALKEAFIIAWANYRVYGITKRVESYNLKNDLFDALDRLGDYVSNLAMGNISTIALAGFTPNKSTRGRRDAPEKGPFFELIRTTVAGKIIVKIAQVSNDRLLQYFCVCCEGQPLDLNAWSNGVLSLNTADHKVHCNFMRSRTKVFNGLTPGAIYYFYVFTVNANGVSPLSAPLRLMVT